MFVSTEERYAPRTIDEYVFPNDEVEQVVRSYVTGLNRRPLILHGPSGTGKSALAKLVPNAIEGRDAEIYRIAASTLDTEKGLDRLKNQKLFSLSGQFGNAVMNYCVIEEYERKLYKVSKLKLLLDDYQNCDLTIFTSNHYDKIDSAIRSRCRSLRVPAAPPERFLPLAMKILEGEKVVTPESAVLSLLNEKYRRHGDNRKYYEGLDELIFAARSKKSDAA